MRNFLFILFLLPLMATAQHKPTWHMGFNTGIIANQIDFANTLDPVATTYNSGNVNVWLGLKAWIGLKHWQLGLAVENGLINEDLEFRMMLYDENNTLISQAVVYTSYRIFSPAVSPMAFAHYKLNLSRKAYMYGGPALGAIVGSSGSDRLNIGTKAAFAGGLNLGISFAINKHARFEIAHAYRVAKINGISGTEEFNQFNGSKNYAVYNIPDFWLQYFTNSIGIVVDF